MKYLYLFNAVQTFSIQPLGRLLVSDIVSLGRWWQGKLTLSDCFKCSCYMAIKPEFHTYIHLAEMTSPPLLPLLPSPLISLLLSSFFPPSLPPFLPLLLPPLLFFTTGSPHVALVTPLICSPGCPQTQIRSYSPVSASHVLWSQSRNTMPGLGS